MSIMLPPYLDSEVKSSGEKEIFNKLKADPNTQNWIVLHSLNIIQHEKRLTGELDFLVMAPGEGIFCLEIKSGNVSRKDGIWIYTNRFGKSVTSTRGPFKQAQEGMYSLMNLIKRKFGQSHRLSKSVYGYGVIFTDVSYTVSGSEEEQWQVYDLKYRDSQISSYIHNLSVNYISKYKKTQWFDPDTSIPTSDDVKSLRDFLRSNFEYTTGPVVMLDRTEKEIKVFTEEQYKSLDAMEFNDRCLYSGPAGTGKTFLAIEATKRAISRNEKVLLVCYNSLLSEWYVQQFSEYKSYVTVGTFHGILSKIIGNKEFNKDIPDNYFTEILPNKAYKILENNNDWKFDRLIVDEGQDIVTAEYLDVMDRLLKGGLTTGKWQIFCDLRKQLIYTNKDSQEILELLKIFSNFSVFRLTVNCRNTKPIGEEISLICGLIKQDYLPNKLDGTPVRYHTYKNQEELSEKLNKNLLNYINNGIKPNRITILSPNRFENSSANKINQSIKIYELKKGLSEQFTNNAVLFSTIHAYKGLENTIVFLTDIEKLVRDELIDLLYVGMSRATSELHVYLNRDSEKEYNQIIRKFLENKSI